MSNATTPASLVTMLMSSVVTTIAPSLSTAHDHAGMDHMNMDHAGMDHMDMGHAEMDHDGTDHTNMDHAGHDMNHKAGSMHDMMMKMYFHAGTCETILFQQWKVHTDGQMVGAVIGVIILALMYEGLKFLREQLYRHQYSRLSYATCAVTTNSVSGPGPAELHKITQNRILSWPHLLQTGLHVIQVFLSYLLMLIFMTFNVWLCLAVLIGSAAGYFLFGWRKSTVVDISDHCH